MNSESTATKQSVFGNAVQRRALLGAGVGQFIEFYDFALYGVAAAILSQHFFPGDNPTAALLATFAAFGAAFVVRPFGGLFFGPLGDRIGRRAVLMITLITIGLATTLIGIMPTYEQIGILAPIGLVLCRLVQGFSAGGEGVSATSFAFEHAPVQHRGLWIALVMTMTAVPTSFASILFFVLSSNLSDEAFLSWGWRLPFLLALPLALIGYWIRKNTEESSSFLEKQQVDTGAIDLVKDAFRSQWKQMLQVLLVVGLIALSFYIFSAYFVSFMQTSIGLEREQALLINTVAVLFTCLVMPSAGFVSDRIGRRPVIITGALLLALGSIPAFWLLSTGGVVEAFFGQLLFGVCVCILAGGGFVFYVEVFKTSTRLTSAGLSFNIAYAVMGGSAPFVAQALVASTGNVMSPGIYVAVVAAIVTLLIVLTKLPETRGAQH